MPVRGCWKGRRHEGGRGRTEGGGGVGDKEVKIIALLIPPSVLIPLSDAPLQTALALLGYWFRFYGAGC